MTQPDASQEQEDTGYVLDAESALEMARLLDQDKVITKGMGGVFPEQEDTDLTGISRILDIACGPGGWVHDVAQQYPHIEVTGIDISKNAINYAKAHALVRKLKNAHFEVMDAIKPLAFPDASFDMVNARLIIAFMAPNQWPLFLAECQRVLRPGGVIRLTEIEWGFTNLPAHETLQAKLNLALQKSGHNYSPTGHNLGITVVMRSLLKRASIQNIQSEAHVIDYSYGMEAHDGLTEDFKFLLELTQPLLFGMKVITPEAFADLSAQVLEEMQSEDFCALWYVLTVWGEKG
ncbi:MAG: hypothetical protein NVS4B12_19620 [Ktedonobacteraceae bacterium]